MRLLVSGATKTLREMAVDNSDFLGCLVVPGAWNKPESIKSLGLVVAADNGAYSGLDVGKFRLMLSRYQESGVPLEWITCPDVVGEAVATFRLWDQWAEVIRAHGFRPSLVLQDGMELVDIISVDPPAVFIGGSTEYKLGPVAREISQWTRREGRPVHMGRVNTMRRINYAINIGCTSCDGSCFSRWPKVKIPLAMRWIRSAMVRRSVHKLQD